MYSQRFNTIFVHIPKTAGQSIETVFLDRLGLKWNERRQVLMRANDDPARGPRKLAHLYAREYVACGHVTPSAFAAAFKFSIVRNPFDRFLSLYAYRATKWKVSFAEFSGWLVDRERAHEQFERLAAPQSEYVKDRAGAVLVDTILRYETLDEDWCAVSKRVFGEVVPLPHRNKSKMGEDRPRLDAETAKVISRYYEADFDFFRYPSTPEG